MIKKVLVSQPRPTSDKSPYFGIAERHGVEIVFRPFFRVEPISVREYLGQRVDVLNFSAVVFTSRHAIDCFFALTKQLRINVPESMKYFCSSEEVAKYIQKYIPFRKRKMFWAGVSKVEAMIPVMVKHKMERYFVPQSEVHNEKLSQLLDQNGLNHKEAVMYRTVSNDFQPDEAFDYDMLLFFSPSGIHSLFKNFPDFVQGDIAVATYGPTTAKEAKEAGLRVDLEAPTSQWPSITSALNAYLTECNG